MYLRQGLAESWPDLFTMSSTHNQHDHKEKNAFSFFFPDQQIVYFLFLHDVPYENTGFKGRKRLVERVGGLGERLWSLTVLTRGGLGAFTDSALLWRRLVGLVVEFEEKRLGLDWVRSIGGRGRVRRTWDRRLMSTLCTGWWGKWYSYKKSKTKLFENRYWPKILNTKMISIDKDTWNKV